MVLSFSRFFPALPGAASWVGLYFGTMQEWLFNLGSWPRTVLMGAAVAVLAALFNPLSVAAVATILYMILGIELTSAQAEALAPFASYLATWGFFFLLTVFLSERAARLAGTRYYQHALFVGLSAAVVVNLFIAVRFPPWVWFEVLAYLALGLLGGLIGGSRGRKEKARREAFYGAARAIGEAGDPRAVAAAIGEHIGAIGAGAVSLWLPPHTSGNGADGYELRASWPPHANEDPRRYSQLVVEGVPELAPLADRRAVLLRSEKLPMSDGEEGWSPLAATPAAWFVPLFAPSDAPVGLLVVALRASGHFSSGSERDYLAVGAQAALALENMRLAEEAREAGEEIGVLRAQWHFSHELHDTLAQNFQSIARTLGTALGSTSSERWDGTAGPEGSRQRPMELALSMAREGAEEARRMIWALRTMPSGTQALGEALGKLVERWSKETGTEGRLATTGDPLPLLPDAKVALFRAAQEALNNVRKHANANRAEVTLSYTGKLVVLYVRDDGGGFDAAPSPEAAPEYGPQNEGGFGLRGMRERVEQLGGTLLLDSAPGRGTTLTVVLPVSAGGGSPSENDGGVVVAEPRKNRDAKESR